MRTCQCGRVVNVLGRHVQYSVTSLNKCQTGLSQTVGHAKRGRVQKFLTSCSSLLSFLHPTALSTPISCPWAGALDRFKRSPDWAGPLPAKNELRNERWPHGARERTCRNFYLKLARANEIVYRYRDVLPRAYHMTHHPFAASVRPPLIAMTDHRENGVMTTLAE